MKRAKVFFTAVAFMIFTGAFSQQAYRSDICQSIQDLTSVQQQKIDKLGTILRKYQPCLHRSSLTGKIRAVMQTEIPMPGRPMVRDMDADRGLGVAPDMDKQQTTEEVLDMEEARFVQEEQDME